MGGGQNLMADVMERQRAERIVNEVYNKARSVYNSLNIRFRDLDNDRRTVLFKLVRILVITGHQFSSSGNFYNAEYRGWMHRLDDVGYSEYADMLVTMMGKIEFGGTRINEMPSLATLRSMYDPSTRRVVIGPAVPIFRGPEPVSDIPESAWEKYYQKSFGNEKSIGPVPERIQTIELGKNYLIKIGDFFPAPYDASRNGSDLTDMSPVDFDSDAISTAVDVMSFVKDGLEKTNERAPDGSRVGDITLTYIKINRNGPVDVWVIKLTVRNLLDYGRLAPDIFGKEEARIYLQKLRLSNNAGDKEAYEKVLALFI
jgi:hypothetical protein